jgi:hypothetical protein
MQVASDGKICAPVFGHRILSAYLLLLIERYWSKDGVIISREMLCVLHANSITSRLIYLQLDSIPEDKLLPT